MTGRVIDELVVTLGLDPRNFTKQQKEAVEQFRKTMDELDKRLKNTEHMSKDMGRGFGDVQAAASGLFSTLAGAGLASFTRDAIASTAATGRMATNIGIANKELSAFGQLIERNGGSAAAAEASLKGLVDTMQRAKWGQASPDFWLGLSQIGGKIDDNPVELVKKLAKFAEKNSVQDTNLTGQRLGLHQDIINVALKGTVKVAEEYKKAMDSAFGDEQVAKLTKAQAAFSSLGQAIEASGIRVLAGNSDRFASAAQAMADWANANKKFADSLTSVLMVITALGALKPAAWILRMLGLGFIPKAIGGVAPAFVKGAGMVAGGTAALTGAVAGGILIASTDEANSGEKNIYENGKLTDYGRLITGQGAGGLRDANGRLTAAGYDYIKGMAQRFGIDPKVAAAVASHEGGGGFQSSIVKDGVRETSYGALQLHVTPGGRGGHLGDEFRKKTGLDPSDPANERATIDFALEHVAKSGRGWKDFHGAANNNIGQFAGIGNVTISNINLPNVTDARGFAKDLPGAIAEENKRQRDARDLTFNANTGLRP